MSRDINVVLRIREDNLDALSVHVDEAHELVGDQPHLVMVEPGVYRLSVAPHHADEHVTPEEAQDHYARWEGSE